MKSSSEIINYYLRANEAAAAPALVRLMGGFKMTREEEAHQDLLSTMSTKRRLELLEGQVRKLNHDVAELKKGL